MPTNKKKKNRQSDKRQAENLPQIAPSQWLSKMLQLGPALSAEQAASLRQEAELDLRSRNEEILALLTGSNPLEVIGQLSADQLLVDLEEFKEYSHQGHTFTVEHLTLLLLKEPFCASSTESSTPDLNQLSNLLKELLMLTTMFHGLSLRTGPRSPDPGDAQNAFEDLQFRSLAGEIGVRAPGYWFHQEADLRALFGQTAPYLRSKLGFDVEQVIQVDNAFEGLLGKRMATLESRANRWVANHQWMTERNSVLTPSIDPDSLGGPVVNAHLIKRLAKSGPSERRRILSRHADTWRRESVGRATLFGPSDLSKESGVPLEVVESVFSFFSCTFGDQNPSYQIYTAPNLLSRTPLVKGGEDYVYPSPGTILWSIKSRLEAVLNPALEPKEMGSDQVWAKYDKGRAKYLESETLAQLKKTLKGSQVHTGLKYISTLEAKPKEVELDGLVIYDRTIFVVEAKAGAFSDGGRKGESGRLKSDVRKIVSSALEQAIRALHHLQDDPNPSFKAPDGASVEIEKAKIERTILITVSLESLDAVHAALHKLFEAGLLPFDQTPWAVSLGCLRVICDMVEFPTQLLDYVIRRTEAVSLKKIHAHDELDWFADYLDRGRSTRKGADLEKFDFVMLDTSRSSEFDDYYNYTAGRRNKPASKPRVELPPKLRQIIHALDSQPDLSGRSEGILALLEIYDSEPAEIDRLFRDPAGRARKDGGIHHRTVTTESGIGITFSAFSDGSKSTIRGNLAAYAKRKAQEASAHQWFVIATNIDSPQQVLFFREDYDWSSTLTANHPTTTGGQTSLEERLTAYHGDVFFPEFSFSRNQFKPTPQRELEFADQVVYFGADLLVFQLKERDAKAIEDEESEAKWFSKKVVKHGSSQLRDTLRFLDEHPRIELTNQKGHTFDLASAPKGSVHQVIIYDTPRPDLLGTRPNHRISTTSGACIHMFLASRYELVCNWLHTPSEIACYLKFRETAVRRKPNISEEALLGQFFSSDLDAEPAETFAGALTSLIQDEETYDIRRLITGFQASIEPRGEGPLDYYKILVELAKLSRSDLRLFKERYSLCVRKALNGESDRATRFYTKNCGFVFAPLPTELTPEQCIDRLQAITNMAKYIGKSEHEVGVVFRKDGSDVLIFWSYVEGAWQQDNDMENDIKALGSIFRPTKEERVYDYFHENLDS